MKYLQLNLLREKKILRSFIRGEYYLFYLFVDIYFCGGILLLIPLMFSECRQRHFWSLEGNVLPNTWKLAHTYHNISTKLTAKKGFLAISWYFHLIIFFYRIIIINNNKLKILKNILTMRNLIRKPSDISSKEKTRKFQFKDNYNLF